MRPEVERRAGAPDLTWWIDGLTVAALASGGVYAALSAAGQEQGFLLCCAFAAIHVLFLGLITRRWWVLPALTACCGAAFLAAGWALGWDAVVPWLRGAWAWAAEGLDAEAIAYGSLRPLALCACALPVSAALYACLRGWFHVAAPAVYVLALNVAANFLGLAQWLPVLLTSLGGLMLCLPRAAAAGKNRLPRRYGQILALPLAVMCLVGAYLLVPQQEGQWRVEPVRALFADVQDWYDYRFGQAAGGAAAGRAELQPLGGRLGGDLDLSPEVTLRVKAERGALVRGAVQDTYDGARWFQGWRNGRFRFDSLLWRGRRDEVFLARLPVGGHEARALYEKMTREEEMEITAQKAEISLFSPGTPKAVRVHNPSGLNAYFNLAGELFADRRYGRGASYTVRGTRLDRTLTGFDENMHRLLALTAGEEDPYEAAVRARHTHLSESLPGWVSELALKIAGNSRDDYEAMCRIEAWLTENCTYSESPGEPPEGVDFVAHFLTTREGYCTYYASAMAVMARACGLPSRYATGYGLQREGSGGRFYAARGVTAHAWAEVYFHGVGWVAFDPLSWDADAGGPAASGATGQLPTSLSPTPAPTRAPLPTAQAESDAALPPAQPASRLGIAARAALTLLAAASAFLALALAVRWLNGRQARRFELSRLLGRKGRRGAGLTLFADLERQMHLYNLDREGGETLSAWARRVDRSLRLEGDATCQEAMRAVERMIYAETDPFEEELAALALYHEQVEGALRAALGRAYLWKRAIR